MQAPLNLRKFLRKKSWAFLFFIKLHASVFPNAPTIKKQVRHLSLLLIRGSFLRQRLWPMPMNYPPYHTSPTQLPFGKAFKRISQLFFRHANAPHPLKLTDIPETVDIKSIEYIANMYGFNKSDGPTFSKKKYIPSSHPLVSILIPAHHHRYLVDALQSAQHQTYNHIEIIVSDDSITDDIQRNIQQHNTPNIRYIRCPELNNAAENHMNLIKHSNGDYIKFLNDDDVLDKSCVETMVKTLQQHPSIGFITSARSFVDCNLRHLFTYELLPTSAIIDRCYMIQLLYLYGNIIGEPTTTLFKKELIRNQHYPNMFKIFNHYKFNGLPGDIRVWLSLLLQSDIIYLHQPLSLFRQHVHQDQRRPSFIKNGQGLRIFQKIIEDLGLIEISPPRKVISPL